MEQKLFTKNDNGFIYANCGFEVKPLGYTSRNHCPFCLCSLHVDILPGDTPEVLQRRVMEQAEWILLPQAVQMLSKEMKER